MFVPQFVEVGNTLQASPGGPVRSGLPNHNSINSQPYFTAYNCKSIMIELRRLSFHPNLCSKKHLHQGASHDPSVRVSCIIGVSATYILKPPSHNILCFSWCGSSWHVPKCRLQKQPQRCRKKKHLRELKLPHFCILYQHWKLKKMMPQQTEKKPLDLWTTGVEICARSFPLEPVAVFGAVFGRDGGLPTVG